MSLFTPGGGGKPEQSKTVTPNAAGFTVTPDAGKTLSSVVVNGDSDLAAGNIKSGVDIFGVTGTLQPGTLVNSGTNTVVSGKRISSPQTAHAWVKLKEFTINYTGRYNVHVLWNAYANSAIRIYKNGTPISGVYNSSAGSLQTTSLDYDFINGDKVQIYGYKYPSGNVNIQKETCIRAQVAALATVTFEEI